MFFSFASWKVFVVVIFISKLFVYLCFRGRKVFLYFMWWKQSWLLACVFLGVMKGVCCFFVVISILKLFVCLCFLGRKVFFVFYVVYAFSWVSWKVFVVWAKLGGGALSGQWAPEASQLSIYTGEFTHLYNPGFLESRSISSWPFNVCYQTNYA